MAQQNESIVKLDPRQMNYVSKLFHSKINELTQELMDVLLVAIERGNSLGYVSEDYQERLEQLQRDAQLPLGRAQDTCPHCDPKVEGVCPDLSCEHWIGEDGG